MRTIAPRVGVGIVVVGLLAAAAVTWFGYAPSWRPALLPGESYGIDVSHHQGPIDWQRVAGDGIGFAYIKATEGGDHLDRRFEENWTASRAAGIPRGAYHFFTLCRPAAEQAAWFLQQAPPTDDALPPALDLELAGNCAARPASSEVSAGVDRFLDEVERAWGRPDGPVHR